MDDQVFDLISSSQNKEVASGGTSLPKFDLDSYRDKNYLTHNLHPYPAKFIPQLPNELIRKFCSSSGTVCDPFCGSGTALLEAALLGHDALGFDLNPLAVLISRAKTAKLSSPELATLRRFRTRFAKKFLNTDRGLTEFTIPEFRNRSKWFTPDAQRELAAIKRSIAAVGSEKLREILIVCFSAIIVKASNQESDTRWKAIDKGRSRGDAIRFFLEKLDSTLDRLTELSSKLRSVRVCVTQANAKNLAPIPDAKVDFVVTSPPYMNSYDYYLYHKLRMFWLGVDHYPIQAEEIGSRNKHSDHGHDLEDYLSEIQKTMVETRRILKDGSFAAYIIGDSILRAKLVRMNDYYQRIAGRSGLRLVDSFSYDQRAYTKAFTANYKSLAKQSHILLFQAIR